MELFRTGQITEAFNKKRLGATCITSKKKGVARSSLKLLLAFFF
jgi:hypothetical protein